MSKLKTILLAMAAGSSLVACGAQPEPNVSGHAYRWAGTGVQGYNVSNERLPRTESKLNTPTDLTFGPEGDAYIADWNNHMIRHVELDDTMSRAIGTDYEGDGDAMMHDRLPICDPVGALGTDVALNHPTQVQFGPDGMLYIAAWHNNKIRQYDPATKMVKTISGDFYGYGGDGGPACAATFNQPSSIAIAGDGTIYIADQRNVRIRAIMPDMTIVPIAGDGHKGNIGDGGAATDAEFGWDTVNTPQVSGSLLLVDNILYIADMQNNRIRRVNLDSGLIDCIAGRSSQPGYTGDGGAALDATFNWPSDLALGPDGRIYVADRHNNVVRAIDLQSGLVDTVLGDGTRCDSTVDSCPDEAPAREMRLNTPYGLTFDKDGNMYVADTLNHRIIKVVK